MEELSLLRFIRTATEMSDGKKKVLLLLQVLNFVLATVNTVSQHRWCVFFTTEWTVQTLIGWSPLTLTGLHIYAFVWNVSTCISATLQCMSPSGRLAAAWWSLWLMRDLHVCFVMTHVCITNSQAGYTRALRKAVNTTCYHSHVGKW